MSATVLRLSDDGRRIYKTQRTCTQRSDGAPENSRKRRVYVDGTQLRRAYSAYMERPERVRADEFY
jgi:hypothetical protein